MKVKLWDESSRAYSDVEVPDGCTCYEDSLDEMVTCPGCGGRVRFGSCYTSRRFYTQSGLWALAVCPACHEREWGR